MMTPAERRRIHRVVDKTKRNAYNAGTRWSDDDVSSLVNAIEQNKTIFGTAMPLGRSFYSLQTARPHVGFALRHAAVLYTPTKLHIVKRA